MKAYLLTSGTIFALFAAMHLFITFEHSRQVGLDRESVLAPALICVASAALSIWAFRLTRRARVNGISQATAPDAAAR